MVPTLYQNSSYIKNNINLFKIWISTKFEKFVKYN